MLPNKTLGQNFLRSKETAKRIIEVAHISPENTVLEVGPGKGILTDLLLQTGARVIAIEKDRRMITHLKETFAGRDNLTLIESDILDKTTHHILPPVYSVVANLPYYITSHFLRLFLEEVRPKPVAMTLMVQREVADRIIARPPHMNLLALSVQAYGTPKKVFNVSRKQFAPPPDVDSAVVSIPEISDSFFEKNTTTPEIFFLPIKKAFSQKRKMLRASLGLSGELATKRPQELTLEDWLSLTYKK
jgi:16S rRNA (adenine1518-N6/adenine1519-N6)-dimethyltransferase